MVWIFQESDPMGGAAGEAYANTLRSPGMLSEHVLAREAIQNSVDAGIDNAKVMVRFRQAAVTGAQKKSFAQAAALTDIAKRAQQLELATPNCLSSLDDKATPLCLLFVEDYNAEGLSGGPHDRASNFYRLLLSLGDRSKVRSSKGSGGSYGFGKSVYSSNSGIQTIFAYTRFSDESGSETTRIFGCGYYATHEFKGINYGGRAWFGTDSRKDTVGRTIVDPLEGSTADALATQLGFEKRAAGDLGTTILIVDAYADLQEVTRGVEDWWWPRLIENKLDVELLDANGDHHVPRPKKRDELRPFIEAFDIARQRTEPKAGVQKYHKLNALKGTQLGACGFVVVPLDRDEPVVKPDRCNTVALIRSPLMVVSYQPFSQTAPPVVGAFMAMDSVDATLKKSEPPAHDRWDPGSTNLRDEEGLGKAIVSAVLSRIRNGLKKFQNEAAPPAPPKQRRLLALERALGTYFKPQNVGPATPPGPVSSPLHLEFPRQPHAEPTEEGMLRLKGTFTLVLDPEAEDDEVNLRLRVGCPILEDDGQEGDDLAVDIRYKGVAAVVDDRDPHVLRFSLAKGEKARFRLESEPYDPAWTVRLHPEVEREVTQ